MTDSKHAKDNGSTLICGGGCGEMHRHVVNSIHALELKVATQETKIKTIDDTVAGLGRQISVIRTDVMKVIADLQNALVQAGEKLTEAAQQLALAEAAVKSIPKRRR
jgi:uncharacterized coiled-coil protein SlyX